ncbi:unnamed protein product [Haemonchus placei]|uniref:Transposase n=1 Tax=Haemonchus placei TaxID=6290 RepID=A0A0N4VTL5_HAEPC|nr:unnamed protein product [Haemonchus placei]
MRSPTIDKMLKARSQWYGHVLRAIADSVRTIRLSLDVSICVLDDVRSGNATLIGCAKTSKRPDQEYNLAVAAIKPEVPENGGFQYPELPGLSGTKDKRKKFEATALEQTEKGWAAGRGEDVK